MTIADEARDNALHFEAVKYAFRQNREGVVVSFVVHPNDIPSQLSTSHIGARYMVALVEIDDNEQPKPQPAKETKVTPAPQAMASPDTGKPKREWRDLQPAAQAGIRANDPVFVAFLKEKYNYTIQNEEDAAQAIRTICCVNSRVELGTRHAARILWNQLDGHFLAWKQIEHA